jgi:DNA-binding response OmpR family regulator
MEFGVLIGYLEDDPQQATMVKAWLVELGHEVVHSETVADFKKTLKIQTYQLLILDWELPDGSGLDVLIMIRMKIDKNIPIVFCTQRDSDIEVAKVLDAGADDYMRKPVSRVELKARVQALLRRSGAKDNSLRIVKFSQYHFDTHLVQAFNNNEPVELTDKDFELALCLFKNNGRVLSRAFLLETVWGVNANLNTRTVDVHVSRIRKSLKISPQSGFRIKTVYQHGYRLEMVNIKEEQYEV